MFYSTVEVASLEAGKLVTFSEKKLIRQLATV